MSRSDFLEERLQLVGALDVLLARALLQVFHHVLGRLHAEIRLNQQGFDVVPGIIVDAAAAASICPMRPKNDWRVFDMPLRKMPKFTLRGIGGNLRLILTRQYTRAEGAKQDAVSLR